MLRNAQRMARSRRIALLDGRDRGLHKPFKQLFDVLVETAIFVGHGGLRGQRERQADGSFRKRPHFASDDIRAGQARFGWILQLISCRTPMTSPRPFFMGSVSMDRVRYPVSSS